MAVLVGEGWRGRPGVLSAGGGRGSKRPRGQFGRGFIVVDSGLAVGRCVDWRAQRLAQVAQLLPVRRWSLGLVVGAKQPHPNYGV